MSLLPVCVVLQLQECHALPGKDSTYAATGNGRGVPPGMPYRNIVCNDVASWGVGGDLRWYLCRRFGARGLLFPHGLDMHWF